MLNIGNIRDVEQEISCWDTKGRLCDEANVEVSEVNGEKENGDGDDRRRKKKWSMLREVLRWKN